MHDSYKHIIVGVDTSGQFHTIMRLNQCIKEISYHTDKVYLTALNAMFMARRVSSKAKAYTRVTTELRKFSYYMDARMRVLSEKFSTMVYNVAESRKTVCQKRKMQLALSLIKTSGSSRVAELIHYYRNDDEDERAVFSDMCEIIGIEVLRLNNLIHIGQNLVVLSKVEATQVESYTDVLTDISVRIETSLNEIEGLAKEIQYKVAI